MSYLFLDAQSFQLGWNFWSQSKMRTPPLRWILIFHVYEHWRKGVFVTPFGRLRLSGGFAHGNQLDDNNSGWDRWFNYQQESSQCHTNSSLPSPKPTAKALENRPYLKRKVIFLLLLFQRLWLCHLKLPMLPGECTLQQTNMAMDINPVPVANTSTFWRTIC